MSRFTRRLAVVTTATALLASSLFPSVAHAAPSHTQITGSGSSWAANAVNQWIADVTKQGLQVVFTSTGSAQGRRDWAYKTTDFGVTDIAYQGRDPLTGQDDSPLGRKFAYLPIVAGGTSFPYNLSFAGRKIRNLRLSGETIAKIFTNQIDYWDDAAIKKDNNNKLTLPHIPVIPVVHSEGSGSTYQFTAYLAKQFGSIWGGYAGKNTATEYFPRKGKMQAQNGSDGVMNFITSSAGNGAIGFDEYSYALLAGFPVAKVLNASGYYTAPTQYNVAVALQKAIIQDKDPSAPDYLTQKLDQVYSDGDKRTYPLSSYSYMIIPIGRNGEETKTSSSAQRQTIADFLYYSVCQGQAEMGPIGYSPLPLNLVKDGFGQIAKLKKADGKVDLSNRDVTTCNNPTFTKGNLRANHLAKIAPLPPACDKQGAGPCADGVGVVNGNPTGNGQAPSGGGNGGSGNGNGAGGTGGGGAGTGPGGGGGSGGPGTGTGGGSVGGTGAGSTASASIDPATGQLIVNNGGGGANSDLVGQPTNLAASQSTKGMSAILYVLAVVLLVAVLTGPVLFNRYLAKRGSGSA